MSTFTIKPVVLPHEGIIPGARGHKKITISKGVVVYCITYGEQMFWCAYLAQSSAETTMKGLEDSLSPSHRHHIPLNTLLAWNFKLTVPRRIYREKCDR